MKKTSILLVVYALLSLGIQGQELTQTIRGKVIDIDNQLPMVGATVSIPGTDPIVGTVTDNNGIFRLENIPLGRITLKVSSVGYESQTLPNIEVNSGKEVVLNFSLQESIAQLDEIVVSANGNKGETINEMSLVSVQSISIEESKRFSGGFDDPGRIVSNYAGIANTADGSSDIIVRGNAPKYIQWRLEGIEITNPYHFNDQNSSFGGLSAFNNDLMANSEFLTGAFAPEYGNVLSGVYDVGFRTGNNEKLEASAGIGIIGTDITLEGPFKKSYSGSYLLSYRYSTAGLVSDLGLIDAPGIFVYQDANFNIVLPTKKAGNFSIFGFGGNDKFIIEDVQPSLITTPGGKFLKEGETEDMNKKTNFLNIGINHLVSLNKKSFIKTSMSFSTNQINDEIFLNKIEDDGSTKSIQNFDNLLNQSVYRGGITYNNKINAKHKIRLGIKYSLFGYDYKQSILNDENFLFPVFDFNENVGLLQNFFSWRYRLNEKITLVAGLHNMNVFLNNKSTIEPRIAINWKLNQSNSIHAGYGNHSTMESIHHYFTQIRQSDGSITEPNKDLGLLKARHYVLGYEKRFSENLIAKLELYYQDLYDLPVENIDTSYFATINEGMDYRYVDLVNEGAGTNYGLEITLERFFDKNYYFLINASFFNSTYKSLENVTRNTQFNQNYLANILFGKEFHKLGKKNNQTLNLNAKVLFQGGRKIIPLLRDDSGNLIVDPENDLYYDFTKAYDNSLDDLFQINLSASYKWNRKKTTHEIFLDLQNLTNNSARIFEYYDTTEPESVGHLKQFGFFPNLMYRIYF